MALNAAEFFPQLDRNGSARGAGSANSSARSSKSGSTPGARKTSATADSSSSFFNELETASSAPSRKPNSDSSTRRAEADLSAGFTQKSSPRPSQSLSSRSRSEVDPERTSVPFTPERASLDENRADLTAASSQPVAAFNNFMSPSPGVRRLTSNSQIGEMNMASESMGDMTAAKSALRQKAVLEFMSQMQIQFGVEPDALMSAFSELDDEALFGRPEDAVSQFLANLQLTP